MEAELQWGVLVEKRHHPVGDEEFELDPKFFEDVRDLRAVVFQEELGDVHHKLSIRENSVLVVVLRGQSVRVELLHKRVEIGVALAQWDFVLGVANSKKRSHYLHHPLLIRLLGMHAIKSGQQRQLSLWLIPFENLVPGPRSSQVLLDFLVDLDLAVLFLSLSEPEVVLLEF
jgi:hypothetical protein